MALKEVSHRNYAANNINDVEQYNLPASDLEIYCKKFHELRSPKTKDCLECPYFANFMGGHGVECNWEDVIDIGNDSTSIPHDQRTDEFLRVSKLIDRGIIRKG